MHIRYDLDLTKTHFEHCKGDITVFGTWFGKDRDPAIVLMPTAKIGYEGAIPCVVTLKTAWKWSEAIGDGAHCARTSVMFADCLGLNPTNPRDVMRVTSIIREHIGDLTAMPPTPEHKAIVADAIRTNSDGKQHYAEIRDYE